MTKGGNYLTESKWGLKGVLEDDVESYSSEDK